MDDPEPGTDALPDDIREALLWTSGFVAAGIIVQWLVAPRADGTPYGGFEILGFILAALPWPGVVWRRRGSRR